MYIIYIMKKIHFQDHSANLLESFNNTTIKNVQQLKISDIIEVEVNQNQSNSTPYELDDNKLNCSLWSHISIKIIV